MTSKKSSCPAGVREMARQYGLNPRGSQATLCKRYGLLQEYYNNPGKPFDPSHRDHFTSKGLRQLCQARNIHTKRNVTKAALVEALRWGSAHPATAESVHKKIDVLQEKLRQRRYQRVAR